MHARPRGIRGVAAVLLGIVVAALVLSAGPVSASPVQQAAGATCERPPARDDDSIHVQGCLSDNREKPPDPVPDVSITVEDESGKEVGAATSNAQGVFDIPLPGTSIDNVGKSYTVKIDESTLPKGTELVDPKKTSLTLKITLDSDVFTSFPIGDKSAAGTGKVTQTLQLLVGGIVFSLLLAMGALGLSLIFGTTGLTNFAHGELITFGALIAYAVDSLPGSISIGGLDVTVIVAVIVSFIASGMFGWVQDRGLWGPLRKRGTGLIAMMIVSIGLSIFLRSIFQYIVGGSNHNYSQYSSPQPWSIGPILLTPKSAAIALISLVVLVATSLALQRTRIGKATRAVADNPALASASGINVERVIRIVWIGGAALAGLSGVLLGLNQGFNYQLGFKMLLLVFAAVTLGGLGTIWGALVGSFVIGILIEVSTIVVPAELKYVSALVVLIVVMVFRPQGVLGRPQRVG
jgi:branched-subunit amino acid ABC-type transport system permease component